MSWGAPGFAHAPVTRAVLATVVTTSVLATAGRHGAGPAVQLGIRAGQQPLWRLLSANAVFTSTGELVFGVGLLYAFRIFERQRGTAKFASFALSAVSLSTALQLAAAAVASAAGALPRGACLSPGPYGFLFALAALFATDVPTTARFTLLRVPMTDKSFTYAAAARLAFGAGLRSLLPAACGLLAGAVVAAHEAAFARLAPTRAALAALELAARALGIAGDAAASAPGGGGGDAAAAAQQGEQGAGEGDEPAPRRQRAQDARPGLRQRAPPAAAVVVDASAVEVLTSMGFDAAAATAALQHAGGDVTLAAELLLASA